MSDPAAPAHKSHALFKLVSHQALLLLTVLLAVAFSLIMPRTFPTLLTVQSILSDKAIIAFLALAEMVVISCAQFDLSVGYNVSLLHCLAIGLVINTELYWPLAYLAVLMLGLVIGLINGLLVRVARIDSFIATLGVGTISYGLAGWYTGGQQLIGTLPAGFTALNFVRVFGVPFSALLLITIAVVMWIVFKFLPIGRYLYVIGANERTAELTGIRVNRYVIATFMVSGLLTAVASLALAARIQVGQSNVGQGIPAAGLRRRAAGRHHRQARPRQCLGRTGRRAHPRRRHLRHRATRRRLLRQISLQSGRAGGRRRHGRVGRAPPAARVHRQFRRGARCREPSNEPREETRMITRRTSLLARPDCLPPRDHSLRLGADGNAAAIVAAAKQSITQVVAPVSTWNGPRTGPKAQKGKTVIYISSDQRNGGALGVSKGAAEAAKAIGWDYKIIDGQGSVPAQTSAIGQAIAQRPDGIILGTVDAVGQKATLKQAQNNGIKVVGWHAAATPGPLEDPQVFAKSPPRRNPSPSPRPTTPSPPQTAKSRPPSSATRKPPSAGSRVTRSAIASSNAPPARCCHSTSCRLSKAPTACPASPPPCSSASAVS